MYFRSLFFVFNLILSSYSLYNLLSSHSFYILTTCILIFYIFIEIIIYVFIPFFIYLILICFIFERLVSAFYNFFHFLFSMKSLFFSVFLLFLLIIFVLIFLYFFPISVVTHWLLVFCIFIYSCNYILVFSSISSNLFLLLRCLMSWSPAVFLIRHYLWLVRYLFFLSSLFSLLYFMFSAFSSSSSWLCVCICVIIFFMYLFNNINI